MAWLADYTTRKKLTTDNTKVDATLTDFPVLVKLTSANFDFAKANADGFDIRFTESDGTTLCKYERERHDNANSLAEYWVKVPSVASASDTDFYIYYRTTDTADGADPTAVWDANYKGVWHLKDDPDTSTVQDSTVSNYDGTKGSAGHPTEANAKIAKGQLYDAVTETIQMGNVLSFDRTDPFTLEAWIKPDTANRFKDIISKQMAPSPYTGWNMFLWDSGKTYKLGFDFIRNTTDWLRAQSTTSNLNDNVFYFVVVTYDGSNTSAGVKMYINGESETVILSADSFPLDGSVVTTVNLAIGNRDTPATNNWGFDGVIDESRISDSTRSDAWIKASYNSGNNSLLTYGSEETPAVSTDKFFLMFE